MDIQKITEGLAGCSCGRHHETDIDAVWIDHDLVRQTGALLSTHGFPINILVTADQNTLRAAEGILQSLTDAGIRYTLKLYDDVKIAEMEQVDELCELSRSTDGILSVGTGSLNDISRLAAYRVDKPFAIFATAPSMDGFASGTAPIVTNRFKETHQARQPRFILADTRVLAKAPPELKAAGFGDVMAKYAALADWRVSQLVTGEYYCEKIAALTRNALKRITAMADKITTEDEEAAGAMMEVLVLTGIAMNYAGSVRPASGAEHIVAHFWEIKKLEQGQLSDFHGKKVGVATLFMSEIYHALIAHQTICPHYDQTDWDEVYEAYGKNFEGDVKRMNTPSVVDETTPEHIKACWPEIRRAVLEELPTRDALLVLMNRAGAATTLEDISVPQELGAAGVKYHPYMRHRMTLARLIPMLNIPVSWRGTRLDS